MTAKRREWQKYDAGATLTQRQSGIQWDELLPFFQRELWDHFYIFQ